MYATCSYNSLQYNNASQHSYILHLCHSSHSGMNFSRSLLSHLTPVHHHHHHYSAEMSNLSACNFGKLARHKGFCSVSVFCHSNILDDASKLKPNQSPSYTHVFRICIRLYTTMFQAYIGNTHITSHELNQT